MCLTGVDYFSTLAFEPYPAGPASAWVGLYEGTGPRGCLVGVEVGEVDRPAD